MVQNAIPWIIIFPADNAIGFSNTYPLNSDLTGGLCYFKQVGPDRHRCETSYIDSSGKTSTRWTQVLQWLVGTFEGNACVYL